MAEPTTIARPYAKAVFAHVTSEAAETAWMAFLQACAQCVADDGMRSMLKNPAVSAQSKAQILADLTHAESVEGAREFIDALAYYRRLLALPAIANEYERMVAAKRQVLDVVITSAFPLTESEVSLLEGKLKTKFAGQTIRVETAVDQSLIGGFEIRSSDTVIDATVKGRLAKVAEALSA
jgi:F-type H+-transporting ATPase subunit delta